VTEAAATKAAAALARTLEHKKIEAYPCWWCHGWHIGREMDAAERKRFSSWRSTWWLRPRTFKSWFNNKFWNEPLMAAVDGEKSGGRGPIFYELCGHAWCPRLARYDHRCGRHQDDP